MIPDKRSKTPPASSWQAVVEPGVKHPHKARDMSRASGPEYHHKTYTLIPIDPASGLPSGLHCFQLIYTDIIIIICLLIAPRRGNSEVKYKSKEPIRSHKKPRRASWF